MGKKGPRRGSISFWHRRRALTQNPRIRTWPASEKGLSGFAAYKVGMAQVLMLDDSESPLKGQEVTRAVTFLAVPSAFAYAIVLYEKTLNGLKAIGQAVAQGAPKEAKRLITPAKKNSDIAQLEALVPKAFEARMILITGPTGAGFKKTPETIEVAIGGKDAKEQFEYAKTLLGKEVKATDVFKEGDYVDLVAVTKGHGWQGIVKRFGVALNPHKATQHRRKGGTLGGETQARIFYTIPRPGQTGYHRRTEFNKRILSFGSDAKKITPKGGFPHYGEIKCDYLMIDGSVAGPNKRMIKLRKALRLKASKKPEIRTVLVN